MAHEEGSRIPDPGFAGDDGSPDPEVSAVLAAYATGEVDPAAVLEVLLASRLLVPVVALPGEVERDADGMVREKTSDMATVLLTRRDGRKGMPAFTATSALAAWNPEARPVPVATRAAARAALQESADALVIDVAGPVRFVIDHDDLTALAEGWTLTMIGGRSGWIRPAPG